MGGIHRPAGAPQGAQNPEQGGPLGEEMERMHLAPPGTV
jgi:hypothetical protein